MSDYQPQLITVSLNPAVDCVYQVPTTDTPADQGELLHKTPAGKGLNVSRVLSDFDLPSVAMGFVGRDARAKYTESLRGSVVADAMLALPGATRENQTILLTNGGEIVHHRTAGLAVSLADVRELQAQLEVTVHHLDTVIFSGSLPPGVTAKLFGELLQTVEQIGAKIVLDTSGQAFKAIRRGRFWMLSPNVDELSELLGRELPDRDALCKAARGLTQKIDYLLVSAGDDGAFLFHGKEVWQAWIEPEQCPPTRNTVGAGDVLLATFLAAMTNRYELPDCLAAAVAAATASITTTRTAEIDWNRFETLQSNVQLLELSSQPPRSM